MNQYVVYDKTLKKHHEYAYDGYVDNCDWVWASGKTTKCEGWEDPGIDLDAFPDF